MSGHLVSLSECAANVYVGKAFIETVNNT